MAKVKVEVTYRQTVTFDAGSLPERLVVELTRQLADFNFIDSYGLADIAETDEWEVTAIGVTSLPATRKKA